MKKHSIFLVISISVFCWHLFSLYFLAFFQKMQMTFLFGNVLNWDVVGRWSWQHRVFVKCLFAHMLNQNAFVVFFFQHSVHSRICPRTADFSTTLKVFCNLWNKFAICNSLKNFTHSFCLVLFDYQFVFVVRVTLTAVSENYNSQQKGANVINLPFLFKSILNQYYVAESSKKFLIQVKRKF